MMHRKICWSMLFLYCFQACTNLIGNYKSKNNGRFQHTIKINKDHTYFYVSSPHMTGDMWSFGTWTKKGNVLIFKPQPFYDTVKLTNKDTLVLSLDQKHDLIIQHENEKYFSVLYEIYSKDNMYPQNIKFVPFMNKLIIKRKKLYKLDENKKINKDNYFYKIK
jgi:hypothetical protein